MSSYYKREVVSLLKENMADLARQELYAFAEDTSEIGNIALRNRIAGAFDLVDIVMKSIEDEEAEESQ